MKKFFRPFIILAFLQACTTSEKETFRTVEQVVFTNRNIKAPDSLQNGQTYLSIYPEIYNKASHKTIDLTSTVSMRNPNVSDTIYITNIKFFNTKGDIIKKYIEKPIYLAPMETLEIIIDEKNKDGGSGANFVFDWSINKQCTEPIFEGVMISTYGQQGLSFVTRGYKIK